MTCGVYKITNLVSGKIYIGSSENVESRWSFHRSPSSKQVIGAAIRKYGSDAFEWSIIECVERERLIEREQHYLDHYQPFVDNGRGYNVRHIAESNMGMKMSEESRRKMSESRKGRKVSEATRDKMKESGKQRDISHLKPYWGRPQSEETKEKLRKMATGRKWKDDPVRKAAHKERFLGKKLGQEQVEKMRQSHLGSKRSDESRRKMSEWQQRFYKATSPSGVVYDLQSSDLDTFLVEHNLNRPNFMKAVSSGKPYKGWSISLR